MDKGRVGLIGLVTATIVSLIGISVFLNPSSGAVSADIALAVLSSEIQFLAIVGGVSPVLAAFAEQAGKNDRQSAVKYAGVYIIATIIVSAIGILFALRIMVQGQFDIIRITGPVYFAVIAVYFLVGYILAGSGILDDVSVVQRRV